MNDTSRPYNSPTDESSDARGGSAGAKLALERALAATALLACLGLLAFKFLLSRRLNVNWDEFYFLSHVYSLMRGEFDLVIQGAYTHLFTWLTTLPGNEIEQIVVARWVMLVLLCVTCWLVWRLACRWLTGFAALVPCFVYLSAMPVVLHGGSFRYDSMLAPLSIAALLLLWSPKRSARRDWLAGAVIGLATVVSIKVVLFAPLFLAALVTSNGTSPRLVRATYQEAAAMAARIALAAGVVALVLIGLHSLTVVHSATDSLAGTAGGVVRKTLLETPWFPRIGFLEAYVRWQPLHWLLIALGTLIALARRRFDVASLALALLPIAFYRNAFPYYYVVMLAPASVLAGYAVHEMRALVRPLASEMVTSALVGTIWLGLLYQGLSGLNRLNVDDQVIQRMLISGVHQIFSEPVNYVDRCGMISSFRKVNFFMSTWGMESYRARGEPFMPAAIRDHRPAFVLVNTGALGTTRRSVRGLLPDDFDAVAQYYPKYWGPLRVAGASAELTAAGPIPMKVPFADRYRIAATAPILVDGVARDNGEVIDVSADGVVVEPARFRETGEAVSVRLVLAAAGAPPKDELPPWPLFAGL
jgi:hypothetical protein